MNDCKIKLNYPRKHAEHEMGGMLRDIYRSLKIKKSVDEVHDDAHHLLLDITDDADVCFKGEFDEECEDRWVKIDPITKKKIYRK